MPKLKYVGDTRRKFSWTSMGKVQSYTVGPNQTISIPEKELPYLMSYGVFRVISDDKAIKEPSKNIEKIHHKHKISPLASVERIVHVFEDTPSKTVESVSEVIEEEMNEVEEIEDVEEVTDVIEESNTVDNEVKNIDYTSIRKAELKKMCEKRNLDTHGNRDDLIARLVFSDQE